VRGYIEDFISAQRAAGFADFAGTTVAGTIPLSQELLNDALQDILLHGSDSIKSVRLTVHDQNRIAISLTVQKWIVTKHLDLEMYLEPEINFPDAPRVRLWLAKSSGLAGGLVQLASFFGLLPEVVKIAGQLIEIDLQMVLWRQKLHDLAHFIKSTRIQGQSGQLLLHFRIEID